MGLITDFAKELQVMISWHVKIYYPGCCFSFMQPVERGIILNSIKRQIETDKYNEYSDEEKAGMLEAIQDFKQTHEKTLWFSKATADLSV